ncbi:hypothetical protein V6N11_046434 [Hibiscus sabdariffa]|uniref:Uncharacterized protein n=2 Tax=Hibiscus sabdariffa TaxID=183260 RepID=A0ABR2BVF9_9ROSI
MIMIHSTQVVVGDNEPSAAPITDVVSVAGPVSDGGPSSAPKPVPTPETTTKVVVSDNEPSAAPIVDVVAVVGPVSGYELWAKAPLVHLESRGYQPNALQPFPVG